MVFSLGQKKKPGSALSFGPQLPPQSIKQTNKLKALSQMRSTTSALRSKTRQWKETALKALKVTWSKRFPHLVRPGEQEQLHGHSAEPDWADASSVTLTLPKQPFHFIKSNKRFHIRNEGSKQCQQGCTEKWEAN